MQGGGNLPLHEQVIAPFLEPPDGQHRAVEGELVGWCSGMDGWSPGGVVDWWLVDW
jgi:hypothetical protein